MIGCVYVDRKESLNIDTSNTFLSSGPSSNSFSGPLLSSLRSLRYDLYNIGSLRLFDSTEREREPILNRICVDIRCVRAKRSLKDKPGHI